MLKMGTLLHGRVSRRAVLATGLATLATPRLARASAEPVDIALVLAVDISRSVDENEARLQREGYRAALTDPRVLDAIRGGMLGAIAVAYVEWSGHESQKLVLPWHRIGEARDAEQWATALERAPLDSGNWTSISGGIDFACTVLSGCPAEATRRVIDVSGDGVNNSGPNAEDARDRAIRQGITINGLPILTDAQPMGAPSFGIPAMPLDDYYREHVIGGPGAFVVAAADFESFGGAVRRKIMLEIADLGHTLQA